MLSLSGSSALPWPANYSWAFTIAPGAFWLACWGAQSWNASDTSVEFKCIPTHSRRDHSLCISSRSQLDLLSSRPRSISACLESSLPMARPSPASGHEHTPSPSWLSTSSPSYSKQFGGAIASIANDQKTTDLGVHIMVAGVSWQVFSLGAFVTMCADFAWRVRQRREPLNPLFERTRASTAFRGFLCTIFLATVFIFVRCVFRCAELSGGFGGPLANNQVTFMILEATMVSIAVILLTVMHPGIAFQGQFAKAGWSLRNKGGLKVSKDMESSAPSRL